MHEIPYGMEFRIITKDDPTLLLIGCN